MRRKPTPPREMVFAQGRRIPHVRRVTKRDGRVYYYFSSHRNEKSSPQKITRLPSIDDPEFASAYHRAKAIHFEEPVPVVRQPEAYQVYFIGTDDGLIKIGMAMRPLHRLKELRASSPLPLRLLAVTQGGRTQENAYHRLFGDHRQHGEWFAPHPEILAEIDRLNADKKTGVGL